jgi:hypothetical protein
MKRFVEGLDRGQSTLFPASLDDYVTEDNPVRAVDVFVDGLDLDKLRFVAVQPLDTGRPGYDGYHVEAPCHWLGRARLHGAWNHIPAVVEAPWAGIKDHASGA